MTETDITPPRPKAYSYVRFSTPEQSKGDSLRRQMEKAVSYAAAHGLDLDQTLTFQDLGVSAFRGQNAATGQLGAFRRAVEDEVVPAGSYLLVENLDRMSREGPWDAMTVFRDIINNDVTIVTLTDGKVWSKEVLNHDPIRIIESILDLTRANSESLRKSGLLKDVWKKKRKAAREGRTVQTTRVASWLAVRGSSRRRFVVLEDKAEVVRRIFRMTLEGHGQHAIAETLNREGVAPFGRGKLWHRTFVRKLLSSESVVGTYVAHTVEIVEGKKVRRPAERVEGYYPPIVDEHVYHDVQTMLASKAPRGRHSGQREVRNLLGGLAACPSCGGTMTLVNKGARARPKLVCTIAKAGGECSYHSVDYPRVEEALLLSWHEWAMLELDAQIDSPHGAEMDRVRRELQGLNDMLTNLIAEFGGRGAGPATASHIRELEAEINRLQGEEERLGKLLAASSPAIVEARLRRLQDALQDEAVDRAKINTLLRQCLHKAVVDYTSGQLELHWQHGPTTYADLDLTAAFR
jgi:DNA invertase Pin-like site-specific DNA recombinase